MPLKRVRELLITDLSELHEVEEEMLRQLPVLAARATDPSLRALFDGHYRETQKHVSRLEAAFELLEERRRMMAIPAVRGLIEESRFRLGLVEGADAIDLALIDCARRLEHYEIAAYSVSIAYARQLGQHELSQLLGETVEDERKADAHLEALSTPAQIHAA